MESAEKAFPSGEVFNMVDKWEHTTKLMNSLVHKDGQEGFNNWLKTASRSFNASTRKAENRLKEEMRYVVEFRKLVLDQLIRVGIPVTLASTGLPGLKWNSGMQKFDPVEFPSPRH